jgi:flagellar biosynthetic protein FliQ
MGPDQAAELMRHLLREALILSAPVLLAACVTSLLISLLQTLTSLQDQTISTVPRLLLVVGLLLATLPWYLGRLMSYTTGLFSDFHRFIGQG